MIMDSQELDNWRKVKIHMENMGTTDNYFYKRAVAILQGQPDPHKLPEINDKSS